jgi:hypothetical protein
VLITLAAHSGRTAALAVVVDPSSLPATVGASAQRANVSPACPGSSTHFKLGGDEGPIGRSTAGKRTLEDAPGSDDTFGLAGLTARFDIKCQPTRVAERQRVASSRGPLRRSALSGRSPAAELPSLDAIAVASRDAEKKVVATSLLTLAASLIDQNLNWCARGNRIIGLYLCYCNDKI